MKMHKETRPWDDDKRRERQLIADDIKDILAISFSIVGLSIPALTTATGAYIADEIAKGNLPDGSITDVATAIVEKWVSEGQCSLTKEQTALIKLNLYSLNELVRDELEVNVVQESVDTPPSL